MAAMTANAHRPGADVIRLVGLGGVGRHGVLPEERRDGQTFLVDLDIHLDTSAAAAGDDLGATVDYATVATEVVALIEGEPLTVLSEVVLLPVSAVAAVAAISSVLFCILAPEVVPSSSSAVEAISSVLSSTLISGVGLLFLSSVLFCLLASETEVPSPA